MDWCPVIDSSVTPENILSLIHQKENVAVLLCQPADELCVRAKQALCTHEGRLRSHGFAVFVLDICQKTTQSEELACVRLPQLRFFVRGKLSHTIVGVFDESNIDYSLKKGL